MVPCNTMSSRIYFLVHSWRTNRHCTIKFFPRHCPSRHILCSSPLPLCSFHRCCLRYYSRIRTLISTIYRIYTRRYMSQNSLCHYIRRSEHNIFSTTLPWLIRYATTLFRLPRCLHNMKHSFIHGVLYLNNSSPNYNFHNLRSLCF